MSETENIEDQIFPRDESKTYALVALMDGTSAQADRGPEDTEFSFPVVLLWEMVILLGITFFLFLFSLIKQAPLDEIANPMVTTNPAKAPWYLVGLQELLEHMHPTVAGVLIPGLLVTFLLVLPYLDSDREGMGKWFGSDRGRRIVGWTALYTALVMPAYILLDNAYSLREILRGTVPQWVAQGLLPILILAFLVALPILALIRYRPSRREIILALFTVMIVSAVIFSITGFLFRGPGFTLHLPWDMPGGYNPFDEL